MPPPSVFRAKPPSPEMPGQPRGREPGLLPYPCGTLVGSGLGTQDHGGRQARGAGGGSGAGLQAHQAARPRQGGQGPAFHPDAEPSQHLLWL